MFCSQRNFEWRKAFVRGREAYLETGGKQSGDFWLFETVNSRELEFYTSGWSTLALNAPLHVSQMAMWKQHSLSQVEKGGGHAKLTFFQEVMNTEWTQSNG